VDDEGRQVERQLKDGLSRRTTIGVALGRLMERYGMDQEQAFAYLCRMSSEQNRKVYVLALEIAESGVAHIDPSPLDPSPLDPSLLGDD
jgi:AmiR/NasT family two-component response regulator